MKASELKQTPTDELIALLCIYYSKDSSTYNKNDVSKILNELERRGVIKDTMALYNLITA